MLRITRRDAFAQFFAKPIRRPTAASTLSLEEQRFHHFIAPSFTRTSSVLLIRASRSRPRKAFLLYSAPSAPLSLCAPLALAHIFLLIGLQFAPAVTQSPMSTSAEEFRVVVYASSSSTVAQVYKDDAFALGKAIATAGFVQINGGGKYGLMGAAIDGGLSVDGLVDIVILGMFVGENMHDDPKIRSSVVTKTMTERKDGLSAKAGGFIALPGGLGTLEELSEIASHRQLDLHMKPLVLLNTNSFYDDLWAWFQKAADAGFISQQVKHSIFLAKDVDEAMSFLSNHEPCAIQKMAELIPNGAAADWTTKSNVKS